MLCDNSNVSGVSEIVPDDESSCIRISGSMTHDTSTFLSVPEGLIHDTSSVIRISSHVTECQSGDIINSSIVNNMTETNQVI